jgi:hypothetical protein
VSDEVDDESSSFGESELFSPLLRTAARFVPRGRGSEAGRGVPTAVARADDVTEWAAANDGETVPLVCVREVGAVEAA